MVLRLRALTYGVVLALAAPAAAQGPRGEVADAQAAYAQGDAAYKAGDFAVAAQSFARADELLPHPIALKWAIASALAANDPIVGMSLVERARGREAHPELDATRSEAEAKFAKRVARLTVSCLEPNGCRATIDGRPALTHAPTYLAPGQHVVRIQGKAGVQERELTCAAGSSYSVAEEAAPPGTRKDVTDSRAGLDETEELTARGAHPAWFVTTLIITSGLGAATIASAIDTKSKYDTYEAEGFTSRELFDDGRAAQVRTNLLLGVTAGGVVSSFVLSLTTRWSDSPTVPTNTVPIHRAPTNSVLNTRMPNTRMWTAQRDMR